MFSLPHSLARFALLGILVAAPAQGQPASEEPPPFRQGLTEIHLFGGAGMPTGDLLFRDGDTEFRVVDPSGGLLVGGHFGYFVEPGFIIGAGVAFQTMGVDSIAPALANPSDVSATRLFGFAKFFLSSHPAWLPYFRGEIGVISQKLTEDVGDGLSGSTNESNFGLGAGLGLQRMGRNKFGLTAELSTFYTASKRGPFYVELRLGLVITPGRAKR